MSFQNINPVEPYKFYLDLAFRRAREKGEKLRSTKLKGSRLQKSQYIELMKMQVISDTLIARMEAIIKTFPNMDDLTPYYSELLRISLDFPQLKKSLGAVNWLRKRSFNMFKIYRSKLMKNKIFDNNNKIKTEFLGRMSSFVKQIKDDFVFLEQTRKILKGFPVIKSNMKTIALVGFPNVGKTTLLYKLTGSKGEINSYPFTTKGVNVSYKGKTQILDTPGTLNRYNKMNNIEKVAHLTIKHCADIIIYIFDPTEEYPMKDQIKLFENLKEFKKEIIVYVSKTDLEASKELAKKYNAKSIDEIKKILLS